MRNKDEVAETSSGDENCVSGLIGNVLTLIISILVWLQKVGCKNISESDCPQTCDLNSALLKLTEFARQADQIGASVSHDKDCNCPKHRKERKEKRSKSNDNYAVLYAVTQDDGASSECKKCCNKVVEPKEKKEKDNVIFEVVAAQMSEAQTQTATTEVRENFTQYDKVSVSDKEIETEVCSISSTTQASKTEVQDKTYQSKLESEDKAVQVNIEIPPPEKEEECECPYQDKDTNVKFKDVEKEVYATRAAPVYSNPTDDEDDYEDEEDYSDGESNYVPCPTKCYSYLPSRQSPLQYRQANFSRGQLPMRQERPSLYRTYESPPVLKQRYSPQYDPYAPMRYSYQPQPYYQKITRTIHRGSSVNARKPEYQYPSQRQMSARRSNSIQDDQLEYRAVENFSQSEPSPPPSKPLTPRSSRNEPTSLPEQITPDKECLPHCPGNRFNVSSSRRAPSPPLSPSPSPIQEPQIKIECEPNCPKYMNPSVPEKPEATKESFRKCVPKCAASSNINRTQQKTNLSDSKQKSQPVSLMPKRAIPVEPRDVLEVEEVPSSKQPIVADSVMSVEASKRKVN